MSAATVPVARPAVRHAGRAARRGRRVSRPLRLLRLVIVVLVVLLAVWAGSQAAQALSSHTPSGPVHIVKPGESVWQIVVGHYGGQEQDVRVLVEHVLAVNDLSTAAIRPGQELVLPPLAD